MSNFYIGWDVGAWKCKQRKGDSCDAIVVISDARIVGHHRGNLGSSFEMLCDMAVEKRPASLINQWFELCSGEVNERQYTEEDHYYVAIDTPLGWPNDLKDLLKSQFSDKWKYQCSLSNIENTLLYRYTERRKLRSGLSVVVDSIGSQSTKGIFLLRLLRAVDEMWGIWNAENITLFETYPKACLVRASFAEWMNNLHLTQPLAERFKVRISAKPNKYGTVSVIAEDSFDAAVCACVAKAFAESSPKLVRPGPNDLEEYKDEGWIFFPDQGEAIVDYSVADGHAKTTCREGVTTFQEAIEAFASHLLTKPTKNPSKI